MPNYLVDIAYVLAGHLQLPMLASVPDRMFKRHGRWHSENAKDGYVKDLRKERLLVLQKHGL